MISRSTSVLASDVRGEILMMNINVGRYFGLDDIGSDIWRRLKTPRTFGELVDGLAADYDADRAVIEGDVRKLLVEMAAHDAVKLS